METTTLAQLEGSKMLVIGYFIYLPIVIALTIFVSKQLFKNGKVFMRDIFSGRNEIADATNKLMEVGFYLMNIGFALVILKMDVYLEYFGKQQLVEELSLKIGGFSIYLGVMLFLNLYSFFRGKRKSRENKIKAGLATT